MSVSSWQGLAVRDGYVRILPVAHGPVEEAIEPSQVCVVGRRLHGQPDPVLGGWTIQLQGQGTQTSAQLVVMEDHHISSRKGGGIISEEAAADVVALQTGVPPQPVGAPKGPVPQQDAEVSMPTVRMEHLQRKLLVDDADVDQGRQRGEKDQEEASGPPTQDCRNKDISILKFSLICLIGPSPMLGGLLTHKAVDHKVRPQGTMWVSPVCLVAAASEAPPDSPAAPLPTGSLWILGGNSWLPF